MHAREENPEMKFRRKLEKFFSENPSFFESDWSFSANERDLAQVLDDPKVREPFIE